MTSHADYRCGFLPSSVKEVLAEFFDLLPPFKSAVVRSIDSTTETEDVASFLNSEGIQANICSQNVIVTAEALARASNADMFTGFDEVWLIPGSSSRRHIPDSILLTSDAFELVDVIPQAVLNLLNQLHCPLAMGDGCGLNYVTRDVHLANALQETCIRESEGDCWSGWRQYQQRIGECSIFSEGRVQTLARIFEEDELRPLHDLLLAMEASLDQSGLFDGRFHLDSGQHNGGWIGYNVNRKRYFYYVSLAAPEQLVFQAFEAPVDPGKYDGSTGQLYEAWGKWRWHERLDLADEIVSFYTRSKDEQMTILIGFLQESYKVAQSLE